MTGEIIAAAITLAGSFFGTFSGMRIMSYRMEQLEKKVDSFNCLIERMAVSENKISVAEHRISDLEQLSKPH